MDEKFVGEILVAGVGLLLSVLFKYFPKLNVWYAGLGKELKRLIMIAVLVVVALIMYGASCIQIWSGVTCTGEGFVELFGVVIIIATGNQLGYLLLPDPKAVKEAKELR